MRPIGIAFGGENQKWFCSLSIKGAFEFGKSRINIAFALHFKNVRNSRTLFGFAPDNIKVFKFALGEIAE